MFSGEAAGEVAAAFIDENYDTAQSRTIRPVCGERTGLLVMPITEGGNSLR
jgi:hypothetical protein